MSEKDINFLTEYPGAPRELLAGKVDVERVRCTAYVVGDVGYKLVRRHIPAIRQMPHAWKMLMPSFSMRRDLFHRAVQIAEAGPVGLEKIFNKRLPLIGSDRRDFGFPADPTDEHLGPPPHTASYFEIDWKMRRTSRYWVKVQQDAVVFGPERVRRCIAGMYAAGHRDLDDVVSVLDIDYSTVTRWMDMGTEFVTDEYALYQGPKLTKYAKRIAPVLQLAEYERFSPPAGYWSVDSEEKQ